MSRTIKHGVHGDAYLAALRREFQDLTVAQVADRVAEAMDSDRAADRLVRDVEDGERFDGQS